MKIIIPDNPNLKAESIFILGRLFAHRPDEPDTVNQIALDLARRYNIPYPGLKELFAPLEAMESDLMQAMSSQAELLEPFFLSGSKDDNWLAWAYFTMERYGADFAALDLFSRRRLLALTLNCSLSLTQDIQDITGLLQFLCTFSCDKRTKWVCTQVWENPAQYYRLYQELMNRATGVLEQHLGTLLPVFQETAAYIRSQLEQNRDGFVTQFGLPDVQVERVLITPTFGGFNGTSIYWDHTAQAQSIILIQGVFRAQIQAMISQYGCSSRTLANRLKILSDPSRIEILKALGQEPMFSQELRERLSLSPGTVTHHMSLLVGEGYVTVKKEGVRIQYSLCREGLQIFLTGLQTALLQDS